MAAVHSASLLPKCLYRLALAMPTALATSSMVIRSNAFSPSRRQADARIAASRAWYICALNETLGGIVSMAGILCMARNLPQAAPSVHPQFAVQQVRGLHAVRAFVDHVQAVVATVLLHREVARVAVDAMDMYGQRVRLQAPLAGPAFGDRCQQFQQHAGFIGGASVSGAHVIDQARAVQVQRQPAFAIGFLRQQHALDIGMLDDAHRGLGRVLGQGAAGAVWLAWHGPTLGPVAGVVQAGVVTG